MTTVICDGLYMIADRRVSSVHYTGLHKKEAFQVKADNSTKIVMPESSFYAGIPIRAIGFAGAVGVVSTFCACIKPDQDIFEVSRVVETTIKNSRMSMSALLLLDDRRVVKYTTHTERGVTNTHPYAIYKAGRLVGIGGGSQNLDLVAYNLKKRAHIQDVFLFLAHQDTGTSETHDVYSVAQNTLVTGIPVSQQYLKKAVETIQANLEFFKPGIRAKNHISN